MRYSVEIGWDDEKQATGAYVESEDGRAAWAWANCLTPKADAPAEALRFAFDALQRARVKDAAPPA